MMARLKMIRLDFKRSPRVFLPFPLLVILIAWDSVYSELPAQEQVWRYGMMLCEYLPIFLLLWPMLHLNSWIGGDSAESLRAASGGRFACGPSLFLIWCPQFLALVPALVLGWANGLDFLWASLYVMLLWMLLLGILYALAVCFQSVALPMLLLLFYFLFGSFPGWQSEMDPEQAHFLNKLFLFDSGSISFPGREGGCTETFLAVLNAGIPYFLAGAALILLFAFLEKKRTLCRSAEGRKA